LCLLNASQVVNIAFDYFNMQLDTDVLSVYDGMDDSAPLLAQLSGTYCKPPAGLTSKQPFMFVRFTSDAKTNFNGFEARFYTYTYGRFVSNRSAILTVSCTTN